MDLYGPLVRSWCVYSGVSGDRIGDVVQEVFLSIHRSCGGFQKRDGDTGFRGWIWMITKNKIRDHFRAASKQANGVGGSDALQGIHQIIDPELPDKDPSQPGDTAALLHRALEIVKVEFREKTWDAFWRAAVLGQATDIIAEDLSISVASVRQAKCRVLKRLRQQLGDIV